MRLWKSSPVLSGNNAKLLAAPDIAAQELVTPGTFDRCFEAKEHIHLRPPFFTFVWRAHWRSSKHVFQTYVYVHLVYLMQYLMLTNMLQSLSSQPVAAGDQDLRHGNARATTPSLLGSCLAALVTTKLSFSPARNDAWFPTTTPS
jgi:hypothetical protein